MGKELLNHLAYVQFKQVRHDKTTQNRLQSILVCTVQCKTTVLEVSYVRES